MNQPSDPLTTQLIGVVKTIDTVFGDGYAKEHPELVGAILQTVVTDANNKLVAKILKSGLSEIASNLGTLALTED